MKRNRRRESVRRSVASLEAELARLRSLLREVAETYVTNLEAEIVQVGSAVSEMQESLKDDAPIRQMIEEIQGMSVKPGKGRRKDLKRIDDLVDRLEAILHEKME